MKTLVGLLIVIALAGCSASHDATTADSVPVATQPAQTTDMSAGDVKMLPITMEKCAECGTEFPKAELVSHDGKMICKHCLDSHGH